MRFSFTIRRTLWLRDNILLLRVYLGRVRQKAQEEIERCFLLCLKAIQLAHSELKYAGSVEAALCHPTVLGPRQ